MRFPRRPALLRATVHVLALAPLAWLALDVATGNLSPNPIQDVTFRTGKPALVLLVATLAVTPAHTLFGWRWAIPLRRTLGLYVFVYVLLHFLVFTVLDYGLDPALLREAILEKRYALVGFSAFLILLPLAVTSTKGWQRRLGRRWKRLHQGVYVAAVLAVVHYVWLVKSDVREPLAWGAVVMTLLALRVPAVRRQAARRRRRAGRGASGSARPTAARADSRGTAPAEGALAGGANTQAVDGG